MPRLKANASISLDGYSAGPRQDLENPLGVGGAQVHGWVFPLAAFPHGDGDLVNESTAVFEEINEPIGAVIMGRNMFGPIRGPWQDDEWRGWWGDDPPYHAPVFVLTHHPRASVEMQGGTTFHFVTDGFESAYAQAVAVAGDRDIRVAGGASAVQQAIRAGLLDQLELSVAPVVLGDGERLLDGLGDVPVTFERTRVIEAPGVTHLRYELTR